MTRLLRGSGARWVRGTVVLVLLALMIGSSRACPIQAQEEPGAVLLALINQARLNEGLAPLGTSTLLSQAAQRHADDLVTLNAVTHEGSDGSTHQQRIREARYQAWNDGLLVNELLWTGLGSASDALVWFHSNPEWADLTDPRYREIGVGYADDAGVHYFVVTLGSRPGVLPVFLNDGAAVTDLPQVALRLTNEDAVSLGDATWMGQAIEVRLSSTPEFEGLPWQPWEPLLPWQLQGEEPGDYAVYVQFRDGAGRTAIAEDTIRLVPPGDVPPTATPLSALPQVTPVSTAVTPDATGEAAEPTPSAPAPAATATPATAEPGATVNPTLFPTWTPLPDEAPALPEEKPVDWPLVLALGLQVLALLLGALVFLRRA